MVLSSAAQGETTASRRENSIEGMGWVECVLQRVAGSGQQWVQVPFFGGVGAVTLMLGRPGVWGGGLPQRSRCKCECAGARLQAAQAMQ